MKSLQQHLNECLVNEAYKAQFKPADWENVLKQFKPGAANYSQLGGLESCTSDIQDGYDEGVSDWIDNMIEGGVQDTPENRNILTDIINWVVDNYENRLLGWRDATEDILDYIKDMEKDKTMWGVSEEDYASFMISKKKLSGIDKKLGEVVAKYGNCDELEDIAASYEEP